MPSDVPHSDDHFDVVVIGAGPAGLSAALVLGRCTRRVLVCDRGTPRSWASKAMHGFLSRDGIPPEEFAQLAHAELAPYTNVTFAPVEVTRAETLRTGFRVHAGARTVTTRKLLIATGLADELPPIEGARERFGTSVFQCPYCDGWEFRDRPLAAYGPHRRGLEMARALTAWSRDVVLFTDGCANLRAAERQALRDNGIQLVDTPVTRLEGEGARLQHVVLDDGTRVPRDALFFDMPSYSQSDLARQLGCTFTKKGGIACGRYEATTVPGLYVAGNIIRNVQLSIVAAAEGANAAFGINRALTREDFTRRAAGVMKVEHTAPVRTSPGASAD